MPPSQDEPPAVQARMGPVLGPPSQFNDGLVRRMFLPAPFVRRTARCTPLPPAQNPPSIAPSFSSSAWTLGSPSTASSSRGVIEDGDPVPECLMLTSGRWRPITPWPRPSLVCLLCHRGG